MSEKVPFTLSDVWLFHAILISTANDREASLEDVVGAADYVNHAMLTFDELDGGIARLSRAGLISLKNKRFRVSAAAADIYAGVANRALHNAAQEIQRVLGVSEVDPTFFKPSPRDPMWISEAFTVDDLESAEKLYFGKAWSTVKKPNRAHST